MILDFYMGDIVRITDKDGIIYEGEIELIDFGLDPKDDFLGLYSESDHYGFHEDDIQSIERIQNDTVYELGTHVRVKSTGFTGVVVDVREKWREYSLEGDEWHEGRGYDIINCTFDDVECIEDEQEEEKTTRYPWSKFYPNHCTKSTIREMMREGVTLYDDGTLNPGDLVNALDEVDEDDREWIVKRLISNGWNITCEYIDEMYRLFGDCVLVRNLLCDYDIDINKTLVMSMVHGGTDGRALCATTNMCKERFAFEEIVEIVENCTIANRMLSRIIQRATDLPTFEQLEEILGCVDPEVYPALKPYVEGMPFEQRIELIDEFMM